MKGLTDSARIDRPSPTQAEQRGLIPGCARVLSLAPTHMLDKQRFELGTKGNEPALVKLRFSDDQQLPLAVDVLDTQPTGLPDAQSEPVQNGEKDEVGAAPPHGATLVGKGLGECEQPLGRCHVKNKRRAFISRPTRW
ncbi:hypothetical protein R69746_08725 [Paraburkholderia aspalathi]|nr:hypothetical protein R75465_08555 [Paraburkholderia aspalathi]CAE6875138.1 hypothetical protein R69746_08725 [Paraburkholderia aspalathi]